MIYQSSRGAIWMRAVPSALRALRTPAAACSAEASAARDSDLARLQALTARMPERTRELIALKYGAGASNRLIARLTGLSESNVGTILHRAVESLRAEW